MAQVDDNKDGNKDGIVGLYLDLRNSLARSVRGIVPPKDVEDIVQETYVRVCQVEQKKIITSPRSYLFKIARNLALDHIKRADTQLTDSMDALDEQQSERVLYNAEQIADDVYEQTATHEEFAFFCEAVRNLPLQCRRVFVLRKVYSYSQREIAEQMHITESTVEKHITKGMKRCLSYMQNIHQSTASNTLKKRTAANEQREAVNKKTINQSQQAEAVVESSGVSRQQQTCTVEPLFSEQAPLNNNPIKPVGKRGPSQDNRNE